MYNSFPVIVSIREATAVYGHVTGMCFTYLSLIAVPWSEGTALYVPVRYRPVQLVLDVLQHGCHLIIVPFSRTMEPDVQPCYAIID